MTKNTSHNTLFGERLREARQRKNIPQDKLGVMIGLDEGCSSARISRYESGIHKPPFATIEMLAKTLEVPVPYFFCQDDRLARLLINFSRLDESDKQKVFLLIDSLITPINSGNT